MAGHFYNNRTLDGQKVKIAQSCPLTNCYLDACLELWKKRLDFCYMKKRDPVTSIIFLSTFHGQ